MKQNRNTCALAALAIATITCGIARADVGVLPAPSASYASHQNQMPGSVSQPFAPTYDAKAANAAYGAAHPALRRVPANDLGSSAYRPLVLKSISVSPGRSLVSARKSFKIVSMEDAYKLGALYPQSSSFSASITLRAGESAVYDFTGITTTAVGDPTIADIVPLTKNQLLINAKNPGDTTIIVFDLRGKTMLHVTVTAQADPDELAEKIESAIGNPSVTARAVNDTILLEGTVSTTPEQQRAEAIANAFTPKVRDLIQVTLPPGAPSEAEKYADLLTKNLGGSGISVDVVDEHTITLTGQYASPIAPSSGAEYEAQTVNPSGYQMPGGQDQEKPIDPLERLLASLPGDLKVINLINFQTKAPRQVLVRAKVIEIDRNDADGFGFDWGTATETVTAGTATTPGTITSTFVAQPILFAQEALAFPTNGLLGGGPIHRFQPWAAQLNALITQSKARVLSQPSLLVLDGNEGDILVGGQIPIPTSQANSNSITITYEPYGIKLKVTPVIVGDSTIQLTVTPEVSDLDFGNAVSVNGTTIPALTIRRVTSTLQMQSGQTLVIGGLYSTNYGTTVKEIPILSRIPILGEFFKDTSKNKRETELLILIDTEIVTDETTGNQPPVPGSNQNLGIVRPFVGNHEFDKNPPDLGNYLQPNSDNKDVPKDKINLPATPGKDDSGK